MILLYLFVVHAALVYRGGARSPASDLGTLVSDPSARVDPVRRMFHNPEKS